jgi:hypothetical protein
MKESGDVELTEDVSQVGSTFCVSMLDTFPFVFLGLKSTNA